MKSFTVTRTETYTPIWGAKEFAVFNESFMRIRSGMEYKATSCFKCGRGFVFGETIGLVCLDNIGNKVICQICAKDLL